VKTVVLFASPNKSGNTAYLLKKYLEELKGEVDIFDAYEEDIKPCIACGYCSNHNTCIIKDNMTDIYTKIDSCDTLVIASPIYFTAFPAPLKAIFDRSQVYWSKKFTQKCEIKKRKGILILTGGSNNEKSFPHLEATAKAIFSAIGAQLDERIYALDTDNVKTQDNEMVSKLAYDIGKKQ
jgi:multimeric flavodoxin WrbA